MKDLELEQLERELQSLGDVEAPSTLKEQVAARVACILRRQRSADWIGYAAAAAALFALWANLSWSATLREPQRHTSRDSVQAAHAELVAQLSQLLPGLSAEEIERQAVLLARHSGLPDGPSVRRAASLGIRQF